MKNNKNLFFIILILVILTLAYYGYNSLNSASNLSNPNTQNNTSSETDSETQDSEISDNPDDANNSDNADDGKVPDFKVYDIDNNPVSLSEFENQAIVINFWASWCPPCRAEMDYFQEAYETYAEKGVKFFMINSTDGERETVETASEYFKENNYTMDMYFDLDFDASQSYGVRSLPMTFFVKKDGTLANYHLGSLDKDSLFANIDDLIGE